MILNTGLACGLALTLVAYIVYSVVYALFLDPLRHVPGLFLAKFTRIWELYHTSLGKDHQLTLDLHRKYGPIVRFAPNRFSFDRRADLSTIYNKNPTKSEYYDAFGDPENPNLLSIKEFKPYVHRLRAFAGLYTTTSALEYEPLVDEHIQRLKDALVLESAAKKAVNLPKLLRLFVFDTIAHMTLGQDFSTLESRHDKSGILDSIQMACVFSAHAGLVPEIHRSLMAITRVFEIPPPIIRLLDIIDEQLNRFTTMRSAAIDLPNCFLTRLFDMVDQGRTTRQATEDCCVSNVAAGADTTSITLSAAFHNIYNSPDVLHKLRQEIQFKTKNITDGSVQFQDTRKMPYLNAVIQETLRVHPAVGQMLPRVVGIGGVELAGQFFPQGSVVGVNAWAAHMDKTIYGADVQVFRPERWLDSSLPSTFAFGAGPRSCIGKHISEMIMAKVIVEIVKDFEMEVERPSIKTAWFSWINFSCSIQSV